MRTDTSLRDCIIGLTRIRIGILRECNFRRIPGCKGWERVDGKSEISTVTLADRARSKNAPLRRARQRPKLRSEPNRTDLFHDRETFVPTLSLSLRLGLSLLAVQADARSGTRDEVSPRGWSRSPREEAAASCSRRNAMEEKPRRCAGLFNTRELNPERTTASYSTSTCARIIRSFLVSPTSRLSKSY